jgi:FkbM family methyltransferase
VGEEWGEAMLEGSFEEACTTVMQSLVSAGSACFDVGGHIGYYSLLLAELTGSTGAVHCFEPFAANAARIRDHVAANSPRARINLHELALSDRSGTAVMVAGGGADGRSSMSHLEDARGVMGAWSNGVFAAFSRVPVQRRRLDDMWADGIVPSPDFIKIDVEGSEAQVLRGASNLLRHAQPSLLIELHNSALAVECAALLTRAGYWPGVVSLPSSERCVVTATPPGTPVPQMAMAAVSTAALR